jgi:hypothetical protein
MRKHPEYAKELDKVQTNLRACAPLIKGTERQLISPLSPELELKFMELDGEVENLETRYAELKAMADKRHVISKNLWNLSGDLHAVKKEIEFIRNNPGYAGRLDGVQAYLRSYIPTMEWIEQQLASLQTEPDDPLVNVDEIVKDLTRTKRIPVPPLPREFFYRGKTDEMHLGNGAMNSVSLVRTIQGDQLREYVEKPFTEQAMKNSSFALDMFQLAGKSQLKDFAADIASRNGVARSVAEALCGNQYVPVVRSCVLMGSGGSLSLAMDRAPGEEMLKVCQALSSGNIKLTPTQRGEFIQQDTKMQLCDYIVGQRDRHLENFMCDLANDHCVLTGIDNDMCLPVAPIKITLGFEGNIINYDKTPKIEALPHVDRKMYNGVQSMTPDKLGEIFLKFDRNIAEEPYKTEFAGAVTRLNEMKAVLENLQKSGRVLENDWDWQNPAVVNAFFLCDSYVKRHMGELGPRFAQG